MLLSIWNIEECILEQIGENDSFFLYGIWEFSVLKNQNYDVGKWNMWEANLQMWSWSTFFCLIHTEAAYKEEVGWLVEWDFYIKKM